jgi:hypothetical protein
MAFFGRGRDQFTQTPIRQTQNIYLAKTEQWVSDRDFFNLYDTTPQLYIVINRKASMMANGQWKHYKNGKLVENSGIVQGLETHHH